MVDLKIEILLRMTLVLFNLHIFGICKIYWNVM